MSNEKNKVGGYIDAENVDIGDKKTEIHYHGSIIKIPKELTAKIPKLRKDQITGRENELNDLHERLFNDKQVVLVNGLGGIGKTTLAQVYVGEFYEEYKHIAWVSQVSDDIKSDFVNTEGLLIILGIEKNDKDFSDLWIETIARIKNIEDKPNLLIIDNAEESLSKLYDYLPNQPNWHVLVTSRAIIDNFDSKELDFLSESDAITLFLSHYSLIIIDRTEIQELINIVDKHTLTIEILAKTAQIQRVTFHTLKNAIKDNLKTSAYIRHKDDKIGEITTYLATIFNLSNLNENEIWLIKQFVFLPSEFHSYKFLKDILTFNDSTSLDNLSETITALWSKGWLLKDNETDSCKMHKIISEVARKELIITLNDLVTLIYNVSEKLRLNFTDNPIEKFAWIPFGKIILETFSDNANEPIPSLQNHLGLVLKELGNFEEAKTHLEKALNWAEKNLPENHQNIAAAYSNLGNVLKNLGNFEEAKKLLEKALTMSEKKYGRESSNTSIGYSNLAIVYAELGKFEEAKELLKIAIEIGEKIFGRNHPQTTNSYSILATIHQNFGEFNKAKQIIESTIKLDKKNLGKEHPKISLDYANLAAVLQSLGELKRAKSLFKAAIKLDEMNFGKEHPTTLMNYSNLATVLMDLNDYKGAKRLLELSIKHNDNNFKNDPKIAIRYNNLALVYEHFGDYLKAKEFSEKALKILIKILPPDHPKIKSVSSNVKFIKQQIK